MLETIREYALERLDAFGEKEVMRRRLASAMLAFSQEAKPHLVGAQQEEWLRQLEAERDNVRATLEWALNDGRSPELALELASSVARFWWARAPREGLAWIERALELPGPSPSQRAAGLDAAGGSAWFLGDHERAQRLFEEGLAVYRGLGDREGVGMMLARLGPPLLVARRFAQAEAVAQEAVAILREQGNRPELALALHILGACALERGELPKAAELLQESLAVARDTGDSWMIAGDSHQLAELALQQDDARRAWSSAREGLAVAHGLGDQLAVLICLSLLAVAAARSDDSRLAGTLWGAVERLDDELGETMWRRERVHLKGMLGEPGAEFEHGIVQGRQLELDDVVTLALESAD